MQCGHLTRNAFQVHPFSLFHLTQLSGIKFICETMKLELGIVSGAGFGLAFGSEKYMIPEVHGMRCPRIPYQESTGIATPSLHTVTGAERA